MPSRYFLCRRHIELQVFANPGVHQAGRRKSAQQSQAAREPAGGVSEFRMSRSGSFEHGVGRIQIRSFIARVIYDDHHIFMPKKQTQVQVHSCVGGGEVLQGRIQECVGKLGVIDGARQQQCAD